jgi:hypothetical protein
MINFTHRELCIIHDAVKYFQNETLSKDQNLSYEFDLIFNKLYSKVTINGMEPAYRSDI